MSEFRQDMVSGDWVIIAPERAKRPEELFSMKPPRTVAPIELCPFEDLQKSGNWPAIAAYPNDKEWEIVIIPNKFPALTHQPLCPPHMNEGPYSLMHGSGHHDLVITRDHKLHIGKLPLDKAYRVAQVFQERYLQLAADRCLMYTAVFFNWGATAGASLFHPHYQVLTLPIIPRHIEHSLRGSREFFQTKKKCAHCEMILYEQKIGTRVIAENEDSIAIAPFASHKPFQVKIFPKSHLPFFEHTPEKAMKGVLQILQTTMQNMEKYMADPDLNFFIHTGPLKNQESFTFYHWHIEVIPKTSRPGGFEVSTGIDINVIDPEMAATLISGNVLEGHK